MWSGSTHHSNNPFSNDWPHLVRISHIRSYFPIGALDSHYQAIKIARCEENGWPYDELNRLDRYHGMPVVEYQIVRAILQQTLNSLTGHYTHTLTEHQATVLQKTQSYRKPTPSQTKRYLAVAGYIRDTLDFVPGQIPETTSHRCPTIT